MKPKLIFTLCLFFLSCCISNETSKKEAALYEKLKNKHLTLKEKKIIKQLEKSSYYKIEIHPPTIGVDAQGTSFYSVILFSKMKSNQTPIDSIRRIQYEIAKQFFIAVIEDSILFDIGEISVTLIMKSGNSANSNLKFYNSYSKKLLEKDFNFKVIRKEDNTFERVTLK